jgi:hypothetical protein
MVEVSCYSMDLYCDFGRQTPAYGHNDLVPPHKFQEFPHQFSGPNRSYCVRAARERGWIFKKDGRTICPKHSKIIRAQKENSND